MVSNEFYGFINGGEKMALIFLSMMAPLLFFLIILLSIINEKGWQRLLILVGFYIYYFIGEHLNFFIEIKGKFWLGRQVSNIGLFLILIGFILEVYFDWRKKKELED